MGTVAKDSNKNFVKIQTLAMEMSVRYMMVFLFGK